MAQRLSPQEILAHLISFPTVSRDTNIPLIDWVEGYLGEHGISAHRHLKPDEPKEGLFAHVGPQVEGAIVLSGHTDVVPVDGQAWDSDPFELVERDGKLFGRGTCDMKGFDALAIWAMVEAHQRGVSRPLQIALTYDEEIGCTGAAPLIEAMVGVVPKGSAVIVGEPSMMKTVTGHKGGVGFDTHVEGFEVHSSIAYQGVSAIHEAARLVQWANEMNAAAREAGAPDEVSALFDPPYTSWHVGRIEGGTAHNITAKDCNFQMGFRAVPGDDPAVLEKVWRDKLAEVEAAMQAVKAETGIRSDVCFAVPPLRPETEGAAEALARSITGDNGTHVVSYGTEAGHFQAAGYSAAVCGPGDIAQAHQPNEFLSLSQLRAGQEFVEALVESLA